MLLLRVGTNTEKRKNSQKELKGVTDVLSGDGVRGIPQFLADDIFGGKIVVKLENWQTEEYRSKVYDYLEDMRDSNNTFIIDELEMHPSVVTKIQKQASPFFDCREEKEDVNAFHLADLVLSGNKRSAWLEFMRLRSKKVSAEEISGALAWKGKRMKKKDLTSTMLLATSRAHNGEADLYEEIEKYILGL